MSETSEPKNYGYSSKRPMWQWIAIYVIIGGIIYAGVYYFFLAKKGGYSYNPPSQNQTQPTTQAVSPSSMESKNLITLTADGYSPATLTVKVGDKVTWANKSGAEATVNSDLHPAHTNYPPLNLGRFADGESLSLTFDKPGTYGYHNHINASEKGTIIVQ